VRAKEATSVPKQSLRKRNMEEVYSRTPMKITPALLLIPKSAGFLANHGQPGA
jgi:hypothetical protein